MATNNLQVVFTALIMALLVVAPQVQAAITCGQVTQNLAPCLSYLQGGASGPVPGGCCGGIKGLNSAAQSTPDRQAACGCLKQLATGPLKSLVGKAAALPGKCSVSIPYKLDPATDCSKVH